MIIAGMDPGKTGALSILYPDDSVHVFDVPKARTKNKEIPLWREWQTDWSNALEFAGVDLVVIELVASMPKQGLSSTFNFGRSFGFIHALAAASDARIELVTPSVWKGKMGLLNSDKSASREKFRNLFPRSASYVTRVKDDGRAEAGLLAFYGRKFLCTPGLGSS